MGLKMALKSGTRLKSTVCNAQVMIIKAASDGELSCGGAPMVGLEESGQDVISLDPNVAGGCVMGKRYVNEDESFEALCTKPGEGSLLLDGKQLTIKEAKKLPSSD